MNTMDIARRIAQAEISRIEERAAEDYPSWKCPRCHDTYDGKESTDACEDFNCPGREP